MRRRHRPTLDGGITLVRQVFLSTAGGVVAFVSAVPLAGLAAGAVAAVAGLFWRSPKEKAQALRIEELERQLRVLDSPAGARRMLKHEATLRNAGNKFLR